MQKAATLLQLINEFIILLLGALLVLLAVTRGVALPSRPGALIALGVALAYWGVRAGMRPEPSTAPSQRNVRSGSLILVGALVAAIPLLPLQFADWLLGAAGTILVLRGVVGAVMFVRSKS